MTHNNDDPAPVEASVYIGQLEEAVVGHVMALSEAQAEIDRLRRIVDGDQDAKLRLMGQIADMMDEAEHTNATIAQLTAALQAQENLKDAPYGAAGDYLHNSAAKLRKAALADVRAAKGDIGIPILTANPTDAKGVE